jgi:cysteine synthase A
MSDKAGSPGDAAPLARSTRSGLRVADDALGLVGATPLVRLSQLAGDAPATVWAKAEFCSVGGSVKDRPAMNMILAAERSGRVGPGSVIVEATSGNTGISLAMIAAVRGYRCMLVMPEDMSLERRYVLKAYGAEIHLTRAQDGMAGAVAKARELVDSLGAFMPSQFDNPDNPAAHETTTALEILEQTDGDLAAFVAGVGTGGTITGVGRVLRRELGARVHIVAVEPAGSAVLSGKRAGMHGIQGLGAGFVPDNCDRSVIDEIVTVHDVAAQKMASRLAREAGLLVGPSSGANVHAAVQVAAGLSGGNVVTVLCDSGERYLF